MKPGRARDRGSLGSARGGRDHRGRHPAGPGQTLVADIVAAGGTEGTAVLATAQMVEHVAGMWVQVDGAEVQRPSG